MRCLLCQDFSWQIICRTCQTNLLKPTIKRRKILDQFEVISFYEYSEIAPLLHTKHHYIGASVFTIMARNSFAMFGKHFDQKATAVAIDDRIKRSGYSHTAILANALKSAVIQVCYGVLRAKNDVSYSGKSLQYRLNHPRGFEYKGPKTDIILVDDIVTTGTTLKEAYSEVKRRGANPLFALTLADAQETETI
ncbi:ComF family protein [Nitratiruptor sp. SB155-2]|uniref:ComF family protein n=1 Tax=Nitratiruptor sp. (strain SB155-2) TaxID=387092 RepID=UPI0001586F20|nr:phosphoribosyltransferase family protein [Nitratiruptor sp. SB155-2]BAF69551.1 transformation system protein [Nitratiruptor sp. SB155-2]